MRIYVFKLNRLHRKIVKGDDAAQTKIITEIGGALLTHWRVTHIFVGNLTIICSDNGLSPGQPQAIIWTNARILLFWPLGTNFNEMLIEIHTFSFKKMYLKMSAKWRPSCLGLSELKKETWAISMKTKMCTFLFWMEHCGIWNRCILGFGKLVYWKPYTINKTSFYWDGPSFFL